MTHEQVLKSVIDKCEFYFNDMLISKELILKKYASFLSTAIFTEEHSVSIALHTGSICFKLVSLVITAIATIILDETDPEDIIDSFNEGDIVLFQNRRYRWCGLIDADGETYMVLQNDGCKNIGVTNTKVPYEKNKHLIKPYYGKSKLTDGRGIRRRSNKRADFLSYVLGMPMEDIPSITGTSLVIVSDRESFEELIKGLSIKYDDNKIIGLSDLVTASYISESGEEYPYGNNPSRAEPMLKITGKISTARQLVLKRNGNKVVGLMVFNSEALLKGSSDLHDLIRRESICFSHIMAEIDAPCAEELVEIKENVLVFACTKEYLLSNSLPPKEENSLTCELNRQINIIKNNSMKIIDVDGGCSWDDYKKIKLSLNAIKTSVWHEDIKNTFLINAYSLFNLFQTAVFPIRNLEIAVNEGKVRANVQAPSVKLKNLWSLVDKAVGYEDKSLEENCLHVIDVLENLYKSGCVLSSGVKLILLSNVKFLNLSHLFHGPIDNKHLPYAFMQLGHLHAQALSCLAE